MHLAENIKTIRETKNLKQIEVANHIGVDKSAYSKIEKGLRALTVDKLDKVAGLFNMTTDQIINYEGIIPKEIVIESRTALEQMRLIQELDEDYKQTIFRLIDKMLTNKKFQIFFQQNLQPIK
jgi:transcriptional regulator with XRE-family HTH domain